MAGTSHCCDIALPVSSFLLSCGNFLHSLGFRRWQYAAFIHKISFLILLSFPLEDWLLCVGKGVSFFSSDSSFTSFYLQRLCFHEASPRLWSQPHQEMFPLLSYLTGQVCKEWFLLAFWTFDGNLELFCSLKKCWDKGKKWIFFFNMGKDRAIKGK